MRPYKIFYSIEDNYPPYRVDITELFSLLKPFACVEWSMRCNQSGQALQVTFLDQKVNLPYFFGQKNSLVKLANKCAAWLADIWNLMACLVKPVDVIQVRDKYIAAVVGLLVARVKGVPFVYWCSFPFPEHFLERAKNEQGLKRIYSLSHGTLGKFTLYYFVMRFANHVFVQSEQMRRDIMRYGVPASKMSPVPMGVPNRLLNWAGKQKLSVVNGRIVYIGTLAAVRQLHVIIDAFAIVSRYCPTATLLMVGDGDFAHEREALTLQVTRLGLSEKVTFTGFVPIEHAWEFAASAEVCLSPFFPTPVLASTSPTKLIEYMALGRAVVCNNHPEQSAIIKQSGAGLCVEWGAQSFADAIISLLKNAKLAAEMGAKGPDWVVKNRTYSIIVAKVKEQYQAILQASL
jgi:glycosyltransferase involved in cell wall biosynthesis